MPAQVSNLLCESAILAHGLLPASTKKNIRCVIDRGLPFLALSISGDHGRSYVTAWLCDPSGVPVRCLVHSLCGDSMCEIDLQNPTAAAPSLTYATDIATAVLTNTVGAQPASAGVLAAFVYGIISGGNAMSGIEQLRLNQVSNALLCGSAR